MAVLEQSWIKVQEKTFGKWCVLPYNYGKTLESNGFKTANVLVTAG
jgi:hypothetical protein